jgi:hypothetical protein
MRDARLLVAVVAALGVAVASSPLPRITPDSATYLTGAERLVEAGRFEACDGPVTLFAPGYSAAMVPFVGLGLDAPDAARLVNVLATLLLVLGAGALASGSGLSRRASVWVAVAVAVSYVALRNGALVWSEPLFCALLTWLLVVLVNGGSGLAVRATPRVATAVVLTWALLLIRHSGVFLLPAVALAAWLGTSPASGRGLRVAAFTAALVAVPALWWLRNTSIDGDPFGRRSGSRFSALEVLRQVPDGLSSLALPGDLPFALRLAVLIPFLAAALFAWRRSRDLPGPRLTVLVLWTTVAVYVTGVTLAAIRTLVDPIDTRLLSPVFVPAVVLVALGIAGPAVRPRAVRERVPAACAVALVGAMALLAPGVVWRGHDATRSLANIPDDVGCASWPARYSAAGAVGLPPDGG